MNYKEFLRSWNPWHLRKRIAEQNAAFSRLFNENQVLQFQHSCHLGDTEHLKRQRDSNYTGLMSECEQLKEENERLKHENRDLNIIVDAMIQNRVEVRFPNS